MTSDAGKKTYLEMAQEAIKQDSARNGTSKQAILKFIDNQYSVEGDKASYYLAMALKKGVESGQLKMAKPSGKGSNSYKIGDAAKASKVVKKPVKNQADVNTKEGGETAKKTKQVSVTKKGDAKMPKTKKVNGKDSEEPKQAKKKVEKKQATKTENKPAKKIADTKKQAKKMAESKPVKTPSKKLGKKVAAASPAPGRAKK